MLILLVGVLAGREDERVFARHDPDDIGSLYVFSEDRTEFISKATNLDLMGAASRNDLARTARALQALKISRFKKEMKQKAANVRHARRAVLAFYERNSPQNRQDDSVEHTTPELIAAAIAAGADDTPAPRPWTEEDLRDFESAAAEREREAAERAARRADWPTEEELYCAYVLVSSCSDVEPRAVQWAEDYANLPEARAMAKYGDCATWPADKQREVGEIGLRKLQAI